MNVFTRFLRRSACHLVLIVIAIISGINAQRAYSLSNCGTAPNLTIPAGPSGCDVQFGLSSFLDSGAQTSVALISSGLVLEAHRGLNDQDLWYRVGRLNGMTVLWGPAQQIGVTGSWPQVAMTNDGYLVELHSNLKNRADSNLYYRVGKLDPNGDQNQSIQWLMNDFPFWEGGFHASISMKIINGEHTIVGVSESNSTNDKDHPAYYRVGHLTNPSGGNAYITWDSGSNGIYYTTAINPHIALNSTGQIVEVHQVPHGGPFDDKNLVHYRRGNLIGGRIQWASDDQPRYNDNASDPAVALNDNGYVTEVHTDVLGTGRMVGELNPSNAALIDWSSTFVFDGDQSVPAISSNGSTIIQTNDREGLYFSTSDVRDRNNWMGDMLPLIGGKTLGQVVVPGTHDAGMYCDGSGLLGKTQDQNIYDQLQGGVRYFDLRVKNGDPQRIYHGISTVTCDSVGHVMGDVKKFMQEGQKEVVVLKFSHFLDFGECLETNEYNRLRATIVENVGQWMYKANVHPAQVPLNDIVADGGKVIVVVDGDWAAPECKQEEAGFYVYKDMCSGASDCTSTGNPAQGEFTVYDKYADTTSYIEMKNKQLDQLATFDGKMKKDSNLKCDLFLLSWTLTPPTDVSSVSAVANRNLGSEMSNVTRNKDGYIPNILYVDYYERARVTDTAIAMNNRFLTQ